MGDNVIDLCARFGRAASPFPCLWVDSQFNSWQQPYERMSTERDVAQTHTSKLTSAEVDLPLALAAGRIGVWELRFEQTAPLVLSRELKEILGISGAQFDGTVSSVLDRIDPADRRGVLKAFRQALSQGMDSDVQFRFLRRDPNPGWLLARSRLRHDAEGRTIGLIGVGIDVTVQKMAELEALRQKAELQARLDQRTAQLNAVNKELESFCYSVSHDLRAPLRSVRGFNEVLSERYGAQLDARGQEFLRRACESSHQMDDLIEGLLKLSRVGRAELTCRPVDLSQVAGAIAADLTASSNDSRKVEFKIAPGLRAMGDEHLLRIALEHLLRNAWKFTSKRPEARIEFGFTSGENAFYVRDDGAGFDPAYADRLFGGFQKLHSSADFPGTGVGLAIVQRIINRHGGRVWATGAVDRGATFYFSLPNHEPL